ELYARTGPDVGKAICVLWNFERKAMEDSQKSKPKSLGISEIAQLAKQNPKLKFKSLAHLIDRTLLLRSFQQLKGNAGLGVDGISKKEYEDDLFNNINDLHERMKSWRYRHKPIRRVYIPKADGKERPIGISSTEDKIVQRAIATILEQIYEQDFYDCSYGFRPKRKAHDAIKALTDHMYRNPTNWVLEADIKSFFDSVNHQTLKEFIQQRTIDKNFIRLIGKCLKAGIMEGTDYTDPEEGTPQGSILSPILANIFLHYVLDEWFYKEVVPRMKGIVKLVRYADDFVICFEREDDARRVYEVIFKRFAKYDLTLHETKTRLIRFTMPQKGKAETKTETFDFLGFTIYWHKTRKGDRWTPWCKTSRKKMTKTRKELEEYSRKSRFEKIGKQFQGLVSRLRGKFNYYGVSGNIADISHIRLWAENAWYKWLNRRSQRKSKTWEEFKKLLTWCKIPKVKIYVHLW
ncbi:MAG: group II intron reverse transcriptase/maturase, partial [Planctomycetia bacterium]|nr:group II intron reverse transcriptase/maturase [Planctomycetia bacterium]